MTKVKVYAESRNHAELWATFEDEELYIRCLPILEQEAKKGGMIITEEIDDAYEIHPCENGVGEWEIRSDFGMHETFDTRQEAEDRLKEIIDA